MVDIPTTQVTGRADPYTVVVIDGIRLGVYAVGGVNVSVGELSRVVHAHVYPHQASGATFFGTSGLPYLYAVSSGSGNIVTITIGYAGSSGNEIPVAATSRFPLGLTAYGA